LIQLRLDGCGPFELHVEGRLHLLEQLLMAGSLFNNGLDNGSMIGLMMGG
jgi:hypothetical protein